jgi:hypothetical protein
MDDCGQDVLIFEEHRVVGIVPAADGGIADLGMHERGLAIGSFDLLHAHPPVGTGNPLRTVHRGLMNDVQQQNVRG